jgi:hypothetical protein
MRRAKLIEVMVGEGDLAADHLDEVDESGLPVPFFTAQAFH